MKNMVEKNEAIIFFDHLRLMLINKGYSCDKLSCGSVSKEKDSNGKTFTKLNIMLDGETFIDVHLEDSGEKYLYFTNYSDAPLLHYEIKYEKTDDNIDLPFRVKVTDFHFIKEHEDFFEELYCYIQLLQTKNMFENCALYPECKKRKECVERCKDLSMICNTNVIFKWKSSKISYTMFENIKNRLIIQQQSPGK